MKKVLFSATVDSHILHFHLPYLKWFKENGYEVHVATNGDQEIPYCDKKIKISFERSPFKLNNLKAIKQLMKVIMEEKYDIIHTHTPMGSVVTRLAAKKARKKYGVRVIYTAHGLHFYKGAPLKNWLLFYPVEKYLSRYTDTLILINKEDYDLAKRKFKSKNIEYVPGVGIDEEKFNFKMTKKEKHALRESLGLKDDDFVMIYVARLDKNKNQGFLIDIMKKLLTKYNNIHLLLVGPDENNGLYQLQAKDISNNVHFLGYRNDIPKLLKISDVAVSSSLREGLPVNIMEAMCAGLPILANNCRGNRDLVEDGVNGYIFDINNTSHSFKDKFELLYNNLDNLKKLTCNNENNEVNKFFLQSILNSMERIYGFSYVNSEKISIIVPIHNSEKYLSKCLNSILSQTYKNLEIILIVDNSNDKSLEICKYIEKKDDRVIVKKVNFNNVSKSRNLGLSLCTGDYIGFVDSDDYIEKNLFELHMNNIHKNNSKISICSFLFENENGNIYKKISYKKNYTNVRQEYPYSIMNELCFQGYVWNKLYSRDLIFKNTNFIKFDEEIYILEDDLFNIEIFGENKKFSYSFMCDSLYHYVKHDTSASKCTYNKKNLSMLCAKIKEIEILKKNTIDINNRIADYVIIFTRDNYLMKKNKYDRLQCYDYLYNRYTIYKKEVNCFKLSPNALVKYITALYIPFIYKIWLRLKNRI